MSSRFALGLFVLLVLASPADAVDGVIEINQARALAGNVTLGDAPDFPVTISAPGSYLLTGNLSVADPNLDGLEVQVDGVTIDLNGFEIAGPVVCSGLGSLVSCGAGTGVGIDAISSARVTVREGRVRGFGSTGVRVGDQAQVRGVIVDSVGGFGVYGGASAIVSGVTVSRVAANGIEVSSHSLVEKSDSTSNGSQGIDVDGVGSSVLGCSTDDNGGHGISAESGSVIRDNSSIGNESDGIRVLGSSQVSGNNASGNGGDGIHLNSGGLASGNVASQNGGDGIESAGGGATVVFNTANGNTGYGFLGAPAVTDTLGGNNFVGNGAGGAFNAIAIQCNTTNGVPFCPP